MSLLAPLERIIHRLDGEAAAELSAVKAGFEQKLGHVLPILDVLGSDVRTAVTDAAEEASPGLRAALDAALAIAETRLKQILQLP